MSPLALSLDVALLTGVNEAVSLADHVADALPDAFPLEVALLLELCVALPDADADPLTVEEADAV